MKRVLKLVSSILLLSVMGGHLYADEKANVVKQGTIRGRIIDTSKQTLPGASIYIENLKTGVISDVNGFYTFANLNPGTYTVKVTYVGYAPVEMKITIPEGKTLERDVILNEGVELQEIVIGGAFQGQRRAINSQKSSLGIKNVVSADQVGKFPDSNIGDALKRISMYSMIRVKPVSDRYAVHRRTSVRSPSTATAFLRPKGIHATYNLT